MPDGERGQSRRRVEDIRFLTGGGRYVDDLVVPGALHAYLLRSPHAHARILRIATDDAMLPGVAGIFTAADLTADGVGCLPCIAKVATLEPLIVPPRPALAEGRVRFVGDAVVMIVAETLAIARDAAELVTIEYDILPAVVDAADALAPGAPLLWDEAPGNLAFRFQKGDRDAVARAMAAADSIVSIDLVNNRVVPAPLEPRAAIGRYDAADGFDLIITGQGVHAIRNQLADDVFGVPWDRMRVSAPDVGGGFGAKNFLYPDMVLVLFAARRLGRTVRWTADRTEDFLSSTQGRDNRTQGRLAIDADGRFLALEVATVTNMGAYMSNSGPGSSTNAPSTAMGGLYDIPAIFMDVRAAFTNTVPIDAYRGAGKPEANFVIERLIDVAALRSGRSAIALREMNLIGALPHRTALGMAIDSGEFRKNLSAALLRADHAGFAARRERAARLGLLRGIGVACFLETARGAPGECAGLRFRPEDGRVGLVLGTQSNGQGHETSFPQIAADLLGLPVECFDLVQADTATVRSGNGHGGARSMHMGGAALVLAIETTLAQARQLAGRLLQCDGALLHYGAGAFSLADGRRVDLMALAREPEGIDCTVDSALDLITFPNGCHVAEVEIDAETGVVELLRYTAIDDYGRLINPMITEGQVVGGLAQGIGQALHEHTAYDADSGQFLAASFMDYRLPRAADLPAFDVVLDGVPTASNPLGVKGSGQAGCIGAPQTIMNAVTDALGIAHVDMPATSERVWRALNDGREHESINPREG